jgi:Tfp pilus assembly protein PilO
MEDRTKSNLCDVQICEQVNQLTKAVEELKPKPWRILVVLFAVFVPLVSAIFGYGQLASKVGETEAKVKEKAEMLRYTENTVHDLDRRVSRLEEIGKRLESMEKKIDRLADAFYSRGRFVNP